MPTHSQLQPTPRVPTPAVTTTRNKFETLLVEPTIEVGHEDGTELIETISMQTGQKTGRESQKKATDDVANLRTPLAEVGTEVLIPKVDPEGPRAGAVERPY